MSASKATTKDHRKRNVARGGKSQKTGSEEAERVQLGELEATVVLVRGYSSLE